MVDILFLFLFAFHGIFLYVIITSFLNSIKVFYGSGYCLVLNIPTRDSDDIPEIVRRLEEISIGCQVKQHVCALKCQKWDVRAFLDY